MSEGELERSTIKVEAGTQLIAENDLTRRMFIIREGKARVFKNYHNQRVTLAILGEGEVFGELSFFDAEPRSASVEALTEMRVIVIDGEEGMRQIARLPEWVFHTFRAVFRRFRAADQKITVLSSINDFGKRSSGKDPMARTIYLELIRFIKLLKLIHLQSSAQNQAVRSDLLLQELDDSLGQRYLGLKVFWNTLKEYDFIDNSREEKEGLVVLREPALNRFDEFLKSEVKSERFLLLGHSAMAVLRRVVGFMASLRTPDDDSKNITVTFEDINLEALPLMKEGLAELKTKKLLEGVEGNRFQIGSPDALVEMYTYQSFLKSFDHSIMHLD